MDSEPQTLVSELPLQTADDSPSAEQIPSSQDEVCSVQIETDSEFGAMKTVSLDQSVHESVLNITSVNDVSANDVESEQKSDDASQTLIKYFGSDTAQVTSSSSDVSFFDTLANKTSELSLESTKHTDHQNAENSDLVEEKSVEIEVAAPPPALLKFFTEEKSGSDQDGKAFFDKIADCNVSAHHSLEIVTPVISTSSEHTFLDSPISSEIEDAWIPSEKTRQTLVSMITSNGSFSPDKNLLTNPVIVVEEDMADPIKALLIECNSSEAKNRKTLSIADVSHDEVGLQKLMEAGCFHSALNLTKILLKSSAQGLGDGKSNPNTPYSLRIWYIRIALFVKLRKFTEVEKESGPFGNLDRPDLYYEYYPDTYKGKKGSMVPFAFRLLLAELPQYEGNYFVALNNMYQLLSVIQKVIKNVQSGCAEDGTMIELSESRKEASLEIWRKRENRVLYSVLNCVILQKEYALAASVIQQLLKKSADEAPHLYSALGRIYLQLGDIKCAQEAFKKAVNHANSEDFQVEENINRALLAMSLNNNEEAYKCYSQAHSLAPNNAMLVNNMAVCLLYMGRLRESLALLEKAIRDNPLQYLHDGLLFNLCTLYELESSRCTQKKVAMLELVSKYVGDTFNVSCLKIQPVKT